MNHVSSKRSVIRLINLFLLLSLQGFPGLAATSTNDPNDWCAGHEVPESMCTLCHPEMIPKFQASGDWCAEHDLPESVCPPCNPPETNDPNDWCAGHEVPESMCTLCHPDLIPKFQASGDWCAEHDLPESVCPRCKPVERNSLPHEEQLDWCAGHDVPESMCTLCNPELIPEFKARGDWCAEHRLPETVCPICNPVVLSAQTIETRTVRFLNADLEAKAGIVTEPVWQGDASTSIECSAQFAYHADRVADLRVVVPGIVRRLHTKIGAEVSKGDPLFELESIRIADTQAHLSMAIERARLAEVQHKRQQALAERGMTTSRDLELAEQELTTAQAQISAARAELNLAGAAPQDPYGRFTLSAPIDGRLIRREAVIGTLAEEETSLGMIADTSLMWAFCDVPEQAAGELFVGAPVTLTVREGTFYEGRITWIATEVDLRTRTVKTRAEVQNPTGRLRANQFARARIETTTTPNALLVPESAVQRVGNLEVVFVRREAGIYEPRVVRTHRHGEGMSVDGRLRAGEEVVTTGAVLLRTEIMPGSIGAGCCEVEPLGGK